MIDLKYVALSLRYIDKNYSPVSSSQMKIAFNLIKYIFNWLQKETKRS